jgi:carbonic anhydrase
VTRTAVALACTLVLAGCAGGDDATAPSWNHDPGDTSLGPAAWGEIDETFEQCLSGVGQSPVDIAGAFPGDLPDLELRYPSAPLVVENTGHVIEVRTAEPSDDHTLTVGDDEYRLVQFHFHAPSEHTLAGRSFDAEVHLVHESENGELAVVGIFLAPSDRLPTAMVETAVQSAPEDAGEEAELEAEVTPMDFLRTADSFEVFVDDYFTYEGSLTTPVCSEGVRWIVLPFPSGITPEATERLHELIGGFPDYDGYENNNRPTQPVNDREIQRTR